MDITVNDTDNGILGRHKLKLDSQNGVKIEVAETIEEEINR